jgi:ACS family D-galactonate transporter-like MFS transporter
MVGTKIRPAIGAPLAVWLITLYDWHLMFVILGLVGLVWLLPWLLLVENDSPKELRKKQVETQARAGLTFRSIMASPVVWGPIIINFCYSDFVFHCMYDLDAGLFCGAAPRLAHEDGLVLFFFQLRSHRNRGNTRRVSGDTIIKRGANAVFVRKASSSPVSPSRAPKSWA